jgi:asparaginyl-tRNA synthetase
MFLSYFIKSFKKSKSNIRYLHKIKDLYESSNTYLNSEIEISGWIRNIKKQKLYNFMHVQDSSDCRHLQIILENSRLKEDEAENLIKNLNFGASILAKGKLVKSTHDKQDFELLVSQFEILNGCPPEKYPFQMKKNYDIEFLRQYPHLRSNLPLNASILRARSHINNLVHQYFLKNDLIHIQTPILTQNDCEG